MAADLRLTLQRLWRRNREGELWRPGLWPRDLAPLFWPLLLTLALALLLGLGSVLQGVLRAARPPASVVERVELQPAADGTNAGSAGAVAEPQTAEPQAAERTRALEPPTASAAESKAAGRRQAGSQPSGGVSDEALDAASVVAAPELRLDPLLELLSAGEDAELLLAARPDPAGSRLSLSFSEAAEALPQAELLAWAQRLQQRAREQGYERLELRDSQGRLRGRDALVGSGMILLAPVPGS